jgi:hypothetical protein
MTENDIIQMIGMEKIAKAKETYRIVAKELGLKELIAEGKITEAALTAHLWFCRFYNIWTYKIGCEPKESIAFTTFNGKCHASTVWRLSSIYVNKDAKWSGAGMVSTLMHEWQHVLQFERAKMVSGKSHEEMAGIMERVIMKGYPDKYYDNPLEINAFQAQLTGLVTDVSFVDDLVKQAA